MSRIEVLITMKKAHSNAMIVFVFIILGFFITIQLRNMKEDYSFVSLKTMSDLQNQVNKERAEIDNILQLIEINNNRLSEYNRVSQEGGSIIEVLHAEINELKMISGYTDLEGEGIIVRLSDSEREMYEWEDNPNDLLIHEEDVLTVVNQLKFAGAEAISINGQRVMSNTGIKCAGPTITINNYTYGQPFVIKAIGDTATLEAAIKSPDSYAFILKEVYGLVVESQVSPRVRIPKYQGNFAMKYINLKEGE